MNIIVCGGRDYQDRDFVFKKLDEFHEQCTVELLIQGGAKGADSLAKEWALSRSLPTKEVLANWKEFGRMAGPIRNQEMLDLLLEYSPRAVIAFPGGGGTENMKRIAKKLKIQVIELCNNFCG